MTEHDRTGTEQGPNRTKQTTEQMTFEPINSQEELDRRIKSRIARERERWEKQHAAEVAELRDRVQELDEELTQARAGSEAEVEAAREEVDALKTEYRRERAERLVRDHLSGMGIEEGKINRIMRHVELAEVDTDNEKLGAAGALTEVQKDFPELFEGKRVVGSGSGGSGKPVIEPEKPLTREEVENMTPEDMKDPSVMEKVNAFLRGGR